MYIALGGERADNLERPERACSTSGSSSWWARSRRVDEAERSRLALTTADASATTSWCSPPGRGSCPRRSSTSTRKPTTSIPRGGAESCASPRRFDGGRIVIGIAGMPYKCPPAPLEVAFLIEAELRQRGLREKSELALLLAHRSGVHDRERVRDGHADPRARRASSSIRSSTSRRSIRSARSCRASRARSCRTTC